MVRLIFLAMMAMACARYETEGTSTGNPLVTLQFKSFSALSMNDVEANTVSSLRMCFKRLRFKPVSGVDENIDLYLGEVAISSTGTLITMTSVPAGTYSRVEFDLDENCSSVKSIRVTNSSGTFSTDEHITIKFDGNLVLTDTKTVELNLQPIINALNTVTSDSEIRTKAESINGSF